MDYKKEYERWLANADGETVAELKTLSEEGIEDAFYRDLAFGTGGLRGVIGAGTNRMNIYTVAKASQGLADYVNARFPAGSVAVSYDSRIGSERFARTAAAVFAANGIRVLLYPALMPTPCLSFAVRYYGCSAGVMVTASHNPAKYNGYKVYNEAGCQITTAAAEEILAAIEKLDLFADVKRGDFDAALRDGMIRMIGDECADAFIAAVKGQSVLYGDEADKSVSIVYSPLNGTGRVPVLRVLKECGFTDVSVVAEQEMPDGNFPTCPYPNPEIREALALGIARAEEKGAELMMATDPDCDRVGIAVRDGAGYTLLTGNEVGLLLFDFICSQRQKHGKMPPSPILVKTIVTTDMAEKIAAHYGVKVVNVLTGFKFIGEQIGALEEAGEAERYIFGFEESYGYLSGAHVRDKDAVNASLLIAEMFAFYKARGVTLTAKLAELYARFGYCLNTLHSYAFEGSAGMAKMAGIMALLRGGVKTLGGRDVTTVEDYAAGLGGLPKSDVLKFRLSDGSSAVVRPSGTEPKIKVYVSVSAKDEAAARAAEKQIADDLAERMK